jgi:hypothetical protein
MMTRSLVLVAGSMVLIGLSSPLFPALAQQKTLSACRQEWRANRSAFQANKITEKAFIANCQAKSADKQDAATTAPTTPGQETGTEKTIKSCQEEWRAKRALNEVTGMTEKAYVEQCRAGNAPASPPTTATPAPASVPTTAPSAPAATAAPTRPSQYKTEAEAKGRCPSDKVVWVDLDSKLYYVAGQAAYGKTRTGAYMCERDSAAEGIRASRK